VAEWLKHKKEPEEGQKERNT